MGQHLSLPGKYEIEVEEPDLLLIKQLGGEVALDDVKWLMDQMEAQVRERGPMRMLFDIGAAPPLSSESRRYASSRMKEAKMTAAAICGGSAAMRAIVNVLIRAAALTGTTAGSPTRFFATAKEGRAWLDEQGRR